MTRQVDNVQIVTVVESIKMDLEKQEKFLFNDMFVEIAGVGLVNRQPYQLDQTIVLVVKYALS